MKDRKLASRYARALLAALPDDRSAQAAESFLESLAAAIERSPELRDVVHNPAIPRGARRSVLQALADKAGAGRPVRNFLGVAADHGRAPDLPMIAVMFRELREQEQGIQRATITSARPLRPDEQERAKRTLEHLTGRKISLTVASDPSLLGGAVTRIGSMVYDGSVRTQLARLRRRMAGE